MRTIAFASFPQDEQDIFRSSCRRWGKRLDEFLVKAEEPDPIPSPQSPSQREVTVVYEPTGKGRRYAAGIGTGWLGKFEDDLQAAYFIR